MKRTYTHWLWSHDDKYGLDQTILVMFRKKISLDTVPEHFRLRISAESRYKLYVNGTFVEYGPAKGDSQVWFYDELDLAPWLKEGENVLAAEVLHYSIWASANQSMFHFRQPGLYIEGLDDPGLSEGWRCLPDQGFHQVTEDIGFAPLQILEDRDGYPGITWKLAGFDDIKWECTSPYPWNAISRNISPGNLQPRPIPFMRKDARRFLGVVGNRCQGEVQRWNQMLRCEGVVTIPPHGEVWAELDAGEMTTAFLSLRLTGGQGACVKLLTSEGYVLEGRNEEHWFPLKGDRTDWVHGFLQGYTDTFRPSGRGTMSMPEEYNPFWWRTFRFVRLEISTDTAPLTIEGLDYLETGYPLEVKTRVETSDESLKKVWDISLRSLQLCMQETYIDCPFYEQLQYLMDARSQMLFTYAVSADDRLARHTIEMFSHAIRYDGLLNCSYPNTGPNIIPGFSIYYILMLHDHMMYFGDKVFLRKYLPVVDGILGFFDRSLNENGLVGKIGTVNQGDYWSFIDWSPAWKRTDGMPDAGLEGVLTMESLLYVYGLQKAAELNQWLSRKDTALEYRTRAMSVQRAIRLHCRDQDGFVTDGPSVKRYSAHSQIFAVLTETVDKKTGKVLLNAALDEPERFAQCSVAMYFYLFRALEATGLYDHTAQLWDLWRKMLQNHLTTCVENDTDQRSDCHGWGALALYELPSAVLGVRPAAPGYAKTSVEPLSGGLTYSRGTVILPRGAVEVDWEKDPGGKMILHRKARMSKGGFGT